MSMRPRPLLAVLSLVPLAAGAVLAVQAPSPHASAVARGERAAAAGPVSLVCPGPLSIPSALLTGGDPSLAVVAPSTAASVRAAAVDGDSSLLFGRAVASETRIGADGAPVAPALRIAAAGRDADGASAAAGPYGDAIGVAPALTPPATVTARAGSGRGVVADAVQQTTTLSGDFRSTALTRCAAPAVSASFLGAGTGSGSSAALVLTNATDRPSTAAVQVATTDGPADMRGRSRVVVAPHAAQTVLLESIAPGQDVIGVSVQTTGAPLAMHLQVTRRDGLTPGGAEIQSLLPDAAATATVPGVHVTEGQQPMAILMNPSGAAATASLDVLGPDGAVAGAHQDAVAVPAGGVAAVPLAGAAPGELAVRVHANRPLQTVVRITVAGTDLPGDTIGEPLDVALAQSADAIGTSSLLALPADGPDGALSLVADTDATATVIPVGADGGTGSPVTVDLPADHGVAVAGTSLAGTQGAPAALVVVPDRPGAVHGAWIQAPAPAEAGGSLLSTVTVPSDAAPQDTPRVTAR